MNKKFALMIFFHGSYLASCYPKVLDQFNKLHKTACTELISIRKQFAPAEQKVYFLLDQLDKMGSLTKEIHSKKNVYKQKYHQINSTLQQEQENKKNLQASLNTLNQKLIASEQQLDAEKTKTLLLAQHNDELFTKVRSFEDEIGQSLSRTSSSDPTSPR
jgi:chromosome segregation ATPase